MPQPGLQLEQRHRLLGVVELGRDRGPGAVARDLPADVGGGDSGLGERRAGLVDGNVQEADHVPGEDPVAVAGDGRSVVLPADAADAQPGDLVVPLAGEQPGEADRADHLEGMDSAVGAGQVGGLQVEPCPQQLGPDVVGDHTGVRPEQGAQAARGSQGRGRVEPAGIHSHSCRSWKNARAIRR
jgi:hypothetical protein